MCVRVCVCVCACVRVCGGEDSWRTPNKFNLGRDVITFAVESLAVFYRILLQLK